MKNNLIFLLLLSLLFLHSTSSLINLASISFLPSILGKASNQPQSPVKGSIPIPLFGQFAPSGLFGPMGNPRTLRSFHGCGDIQISKVNTNGGFGGFTDSFKSQLSSMISSIVNITSPEALALKNRLTASLLSINNILNQITNNPKRQADFKPLLQKQVAQFLVYLDDIQQLMTNQTNVSVVGSNNAVYGSTGTIQGSNSVMAGSQNTIVGNSNVLVGNGSLIAGSGSVVMGNNNMAAGNGNSVVGNNAIMFANGESVKQSNTLTVGSNTIDLTKLATGGKNTGYLVKN